MSKLQSILFITDREINKVLLTYQLPIPPNLDIFEINFDSGMGINKVKEAIVFSATRPWMGKFKYIYIYQANLLTVTAQNALLKLLEEPPKYMYICLFTVINNLLDTVVSRCRVEYISFNKKVDKTTDEIEMWRELWQLPPAKRIKKLPRFKDKQEAVSFVKGLVVTLNQLSDIDCCINKLHDLERLNNCLNNLEANANPTIAVGDAVLGLSQLT